MYYLIDTQILLWWLNDDKRLTPKIRKILAEKPVYCSVASPWEITIKQSIGKLEIDGDLSAILPGTGFIWLDITLKHVMELRNLPALHRDPFDRLIIAQALAEELVIITADRQIQLYDVPVLKI